MKWEEAFGPENMPDDGAIRAFINSPLWEELQDYLSRAYLAQPKMEYSRCSAQPGWNIKYKKKSRSLCTLYPVQGRFIALVVIGAREEPQMLQQMAEYTEYVRELYAAAAAVMGGRWMMVEVTDRDILEDVKRLVACRLPPIAAL